SGSGTGLTTRVHARCRHPTSFRARLSPRPDHQHQRDRTVRRARVSRSPRSDDLRADARELARVRCRVLVVAQVAVVFELADDLPLMGGERLQPGAESPELGGGFALASLEGHLLSILDVA